MNKMTKLLIDLLDQKVAELTKATTDKDYHFVMGQIKILTLLLRESEKEDKV